MIELLIQLVVLGLIFWVIWWFIGYVGIPEPFNKVLRVVIGLVVLIVIINVLLGLTGTSLLNLRR